MARAAPSDALALSTARARSPRTKETTAPSARSASATAMAGTTCPAVPPAAITMRRAPMPLLPCAGILDGAQLRRAAARDVEQQAHAAEQDDQRRRARRDERERHAR